MSLVVTGILDVVCLFIQKEESSIFKRVKFYLAAKKLSETCLHNGSVLVRIYNNARMEVY